MEIDIRQIPEGDRLSKALSAAQDLAFDEVLTLITAEDPEPLAADMTAALGDDVDIQRLRWGGKQITLAPLREEEPDAVGVSARRVAGQKSSRAEV